MYDNMSKAALWTIILMGCIAVAMPNSILNTRAARILFFGTMSFGYLGRGLLKKQWDMFGTGLILVTWAWLETTALGVPI